MSSALQGVAPLPHLGVIRALGPDAVTFLNSQLTNDFALLGPNEARLAAYCTAKGRMQASFIGWKRGPEEVLLVLSRDILAPTLKRLSMFVLRAKVKLTDTGEEFALHGLAGDAVPGELPAAPWSRLAQDDRDVVRLYPADGVPRALALGPAGTVPPGPALAAERWQWGEVRSGIATMTAPIVEAFVPQMLNFESVGGVNFKKGCYPGQEIVARSQFRGTLKRRAFVVHAEGPVAAGQEVFDPADLEQPVGVIAQAAAAPGGGWDAIASLQLAAAKDEGLQAGATEGVALRLLPLPYLLLADV